MSVRKEMLDTMCLHGNTLYTGQTMRINHEECPAGKDTRRRFYITRKPDVLLGYCHNCQNSVTKYVAPTDRYRDDRPRSPLRTPEDQYEYPLVLDFYTDEEQIPAEGVAYRLKYQLEKVTCQEYDIKWSPEHFGIVTPVYHGTTEAGYQIRPLTTKGAKYITCMERDVYMGGFERTSILNSDLPVVITEDYISAVRIGSLGYLAQCNYGVQVKPEFLHRMVEDFGLDRPYIVWLDNDSKHVCNKAQEIANIIEMFGAKNVVVHQGTTEPKHEHDDDILRVVKRYG